MKKTLAAAALCGAAAMTLAACGSSEDPSKAGEELAEDLIKAYSDGDADAAREVACQDFSSDAASFAESNADGENSSKIVSSANPDMNGENRFTQDFTIESDLEGTGTVTFKFGKSDDGDWCIRGLSM
ncbi:hypothetical protein ACFWGD_09330 [Corynebacterium sp. NPDC060344]|uniref:hypothetical protein n=1 Tax=Corynebacterium sp. NPDC060344 TaxID=3347101 RepID=UPI003662B125